MTCLVIFSVLFYDLQKVIQFALTEWKIEESDDDSEIYENFPR